MECPLVVGT